MFIAPTPAHVDRFSQAGIAAGFADDGPPGLRPQSADDYYAAFLKDSAGNSFEAVHRHGDRPVGNVELVTIHVTDLDASTQFYWTIANAVGLTMQWQTADRAAFALDESQGLIVIAGQPTHQRRAGASVPATTPATTPPTCLDPDGNNIEVVNHHR